MKEIRNKGITLIALVITIIVLLILAAISIATLTGSNGIVTKANEAQVENRAATVEELKNLWRSEQVSDKFVQENHAQTLEKLLEDLENRELITPIERKKIEDDGEVTIGKKLIVFEKVSVIDKVGNKVVKNKNEDGSIDYEKLKEDLNTIKNIQGVPSDLTEEKLPLVIKIDDEFIQINKDGTVEEAQQVNVFTFATNSNKSLSDLGINVVFNNCEWKSTEIGNIGGGHGDGKAWYSWYFYLDPDIWFKGKETIKIEAKFNLNAPAIFSYNTMYSQAFGGIGVRSARQ